MCQRLTRAQKTMLGGPLSLAIVLLWPLVAAGQPSIQSVIGPTTSGSTITITGSNFGPGGQLITWDDFEGGANGDAIHSVEPVIGPTWTNMVPSNMVRYSNERSLSGSLSAKVSWDAYSIAAFGWTNRGPFRTVYMTFWRYHDPSSPVLQVTDNHKLAYFYGPDAAGELNQWLPFMIPAGTQGWASQLQNRPGRIYYWNGPTYSQTNYNWGRWETYIAYETTVEADNGYVEDWYNCVRYVSAGNQNLCDVAGGNAVDDIRIGHMYQGYEAMDYIRSYYDDVYISTSRARVELGNAPVFTNCTQREILIPESWESGTITARLHYSRFAGGSQAYVFVVDENGVASPGRAVTLAGTGDTVGPTLSISTPVAAGGTFDCPAMYVNVTGTASDNTAVALVRWSNSAGGSGIAQGTTSWSVSNLPLQWGTNEITVTAVDNGGLETQGRITVQFVGPAQPGQPIH